MIIIAIIMISGMLIINNSTQTELELSHAPQVLAVSDARPSTDITDTLLEAINDYRVQNGLRALQMSPAIKSLAVFRVSDMVSNRYYAHRSPEHLTYADFINKFVDGSTVSCENLQLQNSQDIEEAIAAWSRSASHRDCLLNPKLTRGATADLYYDALSNKTDNSPSTYVFAFIGSN